MAEDDAAKRDRYERATASGLGALVGAAISGPAAPIGAVVGATLGPLLEPMAVRIRDELASDARKRGGEVLAAAVQATGSSEEEFERLIQSGDETRLLAGIALSAASRTTHWPAACQAGLGGAEPGAGAGPAAPLAAPP